MKEARCQTLCGCQVVWHNRDNKSAKTNQNPKFSEHALLFVFYLNINTANMALRHHYKMQNAYM